MRDIEAFLREAMHDAEMTGINAVNCRRLVHGFGSVELQGDDKDDWGHSVEVATQTDGTGDLEVAVERRRRRRKKGTGGGGEGGGDAEAPIEKMLRLSRASKLKLDSDGRMLPPRITARTILQLFIEKASAALLMRTDDD